MSNLIWTGIQILAAPALPHFLPGSYQELHGNKNCGQGQFRLSEEKILHLGPFHLFSVDEGVKTIPGDFVDEKNCYYSVDTRVRKLKQKTILRHSSRLYCREKKRNERTAIIEVESKRISMRLTLENGRKIKCHWRIEPQQRQD